MFYTNLKLDFWVCTPPNIINAGWYKINKFFYWNVFYSPNGSGSKYFEMRKTHSHEVVKVVRESDHWGKCGSCRFYLRVSKKTKLSEDQAKFFDEVKELWNARHYNGFRSDGHCPSPLRIAGVAYI
jgi:hypothetical protein